MQNKIVIVGAGSVGATFAYALAQNGLAREIVLVDTNHERALGEAMDLQQGTAFGTPVEIRVGDESDYGDATAVVITAGAKQEPGETRLALVGRNARILEGLIPRIVRTSFPGVLVMVSNPVDVLTQLAWQISGLPRQRVIGSGTVLDSARLRALLSALCQVDARNVHAMIVGEHGDSEIAAWSAATVGGIPIAEYCQSRDRCPSGGDTYRHLLDTVRRAAYEIISRKGATYYAVGLSLVQIWNAVARDERRVLPISSVHEEVAGVRDVALSLPTVVGAAGVVQVLHMNLSHEEQEALRRSAETIRKTIEDFHARAQ